MPPPQGMPQYYVPGMTGIMPQYYVPGIGGVVPQMQQVPQQMVYGQQHVPSGAASGGANTNLFYKTRMCNKWRNGSCPFGEKCTYAHGQHELRRVSPEILMQQQMMYSFEKKPQGGRGKPLPQNNDEKSQLYYKTRLCIRFMQSGYCVKGSECTFAHGYDDLRLMRKKDEGEEGVVSREEAEGIETEEGRTEEERLTEEQLLAREGQGVPREGNPYADDTQCLDD
jgi:hypothetical protein